MNKQVQQPVTTHRVRDHYAEARTLERKLRNIDVQVAKAAVAAEHKKRALLEAASPTVRRLAEAALSEPTEAVGNNQTNDAGGEQ